MKLIGGKISGGGGTHQPSGQWMVVSDPSLSMLLTDEHEDSDEEKETFRSVRETSLL